MPRKYFCFVASMLLFCTSIGFAAEQNRNPVEEFRYSTKIIFSSCKIQANTAFVMSAAGDASGLSSGGIANCINEGRAKIKEYFQKANAHLIKKPTASKLLKEYYVVWLTGLGATDPALGESMTSYNQRVGEASRRINEAWIRFDIEFPTRPDGLPGIFALE